MKEEKEGKNRAWGRKHPRHLAFLCIPALRTVPVMEQVLNKCLLMVSEDDLDP